MIRRRGHWVIAYRGPTKPEMLKRQQTRLSRKRRKHLMADNYPEQIECDLGPEFRSHKGASWRYTAPSRWSEREQRAYAVRAKAAQRGDGEGQRECLSWLDSVLHQ